MGETDRYIEYKDKYRRPGISFNINSPAVVLIIINFTIFLFVKFLDFGKITGDSSVVPFFNDNIHYFLGPVSFGSLLRQPWSAVTYGFFHFDFLTILGNMLWLFAFGSLLQSIAGNSKIIPVYIYGAVAGVITFTACCYLPNANPAKLPLYGANAAVMAIAVAATTLAPNFRILQQLGKGIPIWILTAVYIFIDLVGLARGGAIPFFASHLAGALIGFLFVVSYQRGYDWSVWMNRFYYKAIHLFEPAKKNKKVPVKERVFYNTGNRAPYQKTANVTQQRVDEILDKISQKGYDYLTSEEKNILKRASEEEL